MDGSESLTLDFSPRVASSPYTTNEYCVQGKMQWLQDIFVPEFGSSILERAVFDKRKFNYPGVALIDDKGDVDTNNGQATWQHVVFDKPHNKNSSARFRLHDWRAINLEKILEEARALAKENLRH